MLVSQIVIGMYIKGLQPKQQHFGIISNDDFSYLIKWRTNVYHWQIRLIYAVEHKLNDLISCWRIQIRAQLIYYQWNIFPASFWWKKNIQEMELNLSFPYIKQNLYNTRAVNFDIPQTHILDYLTLDGGWIVIFCIYLYLHTWYEQHEQNKTSSIDFHLICLHKSYKVSNDGMFNIINWDRTYEPYTRAMWYYPLFSVNYTV